MTIIDPIDPTQLHAGMEVIGSDDKRVGRIKEVRSAELHIDRPMRPDIVLSFGFIRTIRGEQVLLTIPAGEAAEKDWRGAI